MTISYYPGCTLKSKARNLEDAALAAFEKLGIEVKELDRWNCCGAFFSLADDDLLHQLAPVRVLIRAKDEGSEQLVTLCSQCYNTLARANQLVRDDEEKRNTLNAFMTEETDYFGEVEVKHFLDLVVEKIGWDSLKEKVSNPLTGLKIAPVYGCSMVRPYDVAVGGEHTTVMSDFIEALGATPVDFSASKECCGSYELLVHPEEGLRRATKVVSSAARAGVDAMILSCPACEHNLGRKQKAMRSETPDLPEVPVFYFSQLLAIALGVDAETCHFELNMGSARELLQARGFIADAA